MSGHNKWSKIKHKKAATDAAKSKVFGKIVKLIAAESKKCGGDVNAPGLRAAIEKAKAVNMPSDNIDRAVKKGQSADQATMEVVHYEAYGPGGCGIIITGLTDNKNRTAQEIKHALSKNGIELAAPGSASWMFENNQGEFSPTTTVALSESDMGKLETLVETLEENDDVQEVFTNVE
ncbi:MAG: YebC/PmpR family DNA-binding transcriptional regulator [Parcubacteria group bacterium]|nr:YebC/PmpR family DNA-binding transcriptional regulator [Parcubacteria group bacterium]